MGWTLDPVRTCARLAVAQVRHNWVRTGLSVIGIAVAVLTVTLLGSIGYGVVDAGQEKFEATGQDLWVTGGAVELTPGRIGGVSPSLTDAHSVSREIQGRAGVRSATPMGFQTVYVGTHPDDLTTRVGMGVPGDTLTVQTTAGHYFRQGDRHYANGTYTGPMTQTVVIDPQTASQLNVSVGETLHIGGTVVSARNHEFTVIGISPAFGGFLGTPTVTMHLSELQELTGSTRRDPATMIGVAVATDVDTQTIETKLAHTYPQYHVQTNRERLQTLFQDKVVVIVSGVVLVVLAVSAGFALTITLASQMVYVQQTEFTALIAAGISRRMLLGIMAFQGLIVGSLGGIVGVVLTPPAVAGLNALTTHFATTQLLYTPRELLVAGGGLAIGIGTIGVLLASWRLVHIHPHTQLS